MDYKQSMAEIISLIASVINIIEGINKADKLIRKYIHSNPSIRREMVPMLAKTTASPGLIQAVELEAELEEYDESLKVLAHVTCENPIQKNTQYTFYTMLCSPTSKVNRRSGRAGSFSNLPTSVKGSSS